MSDASKYHVKVDLIREARFVEKISTILGIAGLRLVSKHLYMPKVVYTLSL